MTIAVAQTMPAPQRLWAYSAFAAVLSGAGLPIYIYAPKFYADTYGVSLASLGAMLFALRLFDVVQDPALGWLSSRVQRRKALSVGIGATLLAGSMVALFAVPPPVPPLLWFALSLTGLFSGFSFLSITFYAQGIAKAETIGSHTRLAAWRESGALLGVCLAAIAPTALMPVSGAPFAIFAGGFALCVVLAARAMAQEWQSGPVRAPGQAASDLAPHAGFRAVLADRVSRRLLILALVNAMPVAASSTLFLFFVESRLAAPGWEGALLVLYFLAAAAAAPGWSLLADRFGARRTLLAAMVLAILSYVWVLSLGAGDVAAFAVICVLSGATIGADLTLLPALFAKRLAQVAPAGGEGFGLWTFANKITLAFAAALLLPMLEAAGLSQTPPAQAALDLLTLLYAAVPCVLKLAAIVLLWTTPLPEDS